MDLAVSTLIFHPEGSFHGPAPFSYGAFLSDLVKLSSSSEVGIPCSVHITDRGCSQWLCISCGSGSCAPEMLMTVATKRKLSSH